MQTRNENVILFPKWRTALEEKSLQALKEKRYEEALSQLNELISYQINNHEIIIGKLICLMELGRYEEAQQLCEEVIRNKDENYFHYVHIYLTILFQTNQYALLMEQVEYELTDKTMPKMIREQFEQLYDLSEKMEKDSNIEKSIEYIDDLQQAVDQHNHIEQWRLVEMMRKTSTNPPEKVVDLLKNEEVHPVVKTTIFLWLQDEKFPRKVDIHKLGQTLHILPANIVDIKSHPTIKQTMLIISELEQQNPSLHHLLDKLLYRYAYVRYPLLPETEDVPYIAKALKVIGEQYMNIHNEEKELPVDHAKRYAEEIKICEKLYLSIIEE